MTLFDTEEGKGRLTIRMSAELPNIDLATEAVERCLPEDDPALNSFGVALAVREGLTNAVVHGSMGDSRRQVTCELKLDRGLLTVEITDEGDGFDWRAHDPVFPSPDSPGHRGIAIMRHYFDECRFNEKGNKILLTKRGLC